MECTQARTLIPSYLDGELSEAQAAPLRRHLLDCQPCRAGAQGEKNVKRWFAPDDSIEIPEGFAARVARRAFAGDTGEGFATGAAARDEGGLQRFVLQVTAAAALLLLVLSVALRSLSLPPGSRLMAKSGAEVNLDRAILELDRLNTPASPAPLPRGRPDAAPAAGPVQGEARRP